MKSKLLLFLLFIALVIAGIYYASSNSNSDSQLNKMNMELIGKWRVEDFLSDKKFEQKKVVIEAKREALSSEFTFHGDHSFMLKSYNFSNGLKGTWIIEKNENEYKLILTVKNKDFYDDRFGNFSIEILEDDHMIWISDHGQFGIIIEILERNSDGAFEFYN